MSTEPTRSDDSTNVIIVDDHPAIVEALRMAIDQEMDMHVGGHAQTTKEAMDLVDEDDEVDAVVLDLSLQDTHGFEFLSYVQNFHERLPVIIYSMYDEQIYAERAVRSGAMGYLMKSAPSSEVIAAIRSALRGTVYLSSEMGTHIVNRLSQSDRADGSFSIDTLTDRELTVFQMLGEGYSLDEITDRLCLTRKTVEAYRRRAKEKLGLDSTSELLQYAIQWTYGQAQDEESPDSTPVEQSDSSYADQAKDQ